MKKPIIILIIILALITLVALYWFVRGDACLTQPPYFNCHIQNKFAEIDAEFNNLSGQILSLNEPSIFNIDKYDGIFSFDHIGEDTDVGVGWTRIMQNEEIRDSLGFYTNYIDPILTPLTENTLIGSAWQWPKDSKLYNGPFFNYYLDFSRRQTTVLPTKGKLMAKSSDGKKVVFLESECVKNPAVMEIDHSCNNKNLSLRLITLPPVNDGYFITHFEATKLLDFNHIIFSPDDTRLVIEAKIEAMDYDTPTAYWNLFIIDTENGEIIKQNNRLSKSRYEHVFWSDNVNIIYW
ncbi:MAG: hypothetical protein ACKKL5_00850 [Candidatus Komeilibacteria bacterium]